MLEQRVAWDRHQDVVAGRLAEQFEKEGIGFAGARREDDLRRADTQTSARVVFRHRFARPPDAERRRFVHERFCTVERREQTAEMEALRELLPYRGEAAAVGS